MKESCCIDLVAYISARACLVHLCINLYSIFYFYESPLIRVSSTSAILRHIVVYLLLWLHGLLNLIPADTSKLGLLGLVTLDSKSVVVHILAEILFYVEPTGARDNQHLSLVPLFLSRLCVA